MPGQSNSGGIPKSEPSVVLVEELEQNFTPRYENGMSDEVIEMILKKAKILFRIWRKLGSTSAVRYVVNMKNDYMLSGMLSLLDEKRELWTFDMFQTMLSEIYRLSKHYDEEYLELAANTLIFLISGFKPVIINNLSTPEKWADAGRVRRQLECKATYERLIEIKHHLLSRRRELFNTRVFSLHEEVIALVQDLEDSPHR